MHGVKVLVTVGLALRRRRRRGSGIDQLTTPTTYLSFASDHTRKQERVDAGVSSKREACVSSKRSVGVTSGLFSSSSSTSKKRMHQDVVALHHNNGGERGNALELDELLVSRIINVDPAIHTNMRAVNNKCACQPEAPPLRASTTLASHGLQRVSMLQGHLAAHPASPKCPAAVRVGQPRRACSTEVMICDQKLWAKGAFQIGFRHHGPTDVQIPPSLRVEGSARLVCVCGVLLVRPSFSESLILSLSPFSLCALSLSFARAFFLRARSLVISDCVRVWTGNADGREWRGGWPQPLVAR